VTALMHALTEKHEEIQEISEITLQSTSNHIVSLTLVHKNKIDECSLSTTNKKINKVEIINFLMYFEQRFSRCNLKTTILQT
jgi:hypothetical protein